MRSKPVVWRAALTVVLSWQIAAPAIAGPYGDSLGKCLVAATTSQEKTMLVQWMFATLSLHPDVKAFSAVTPEQRAQINKDTARLFERLLTVACASETTEAVEYEGPSTVEGAFSLLGQVAMRELFANPNVAAGMEDLSKNFDAEKLQKVLGKAPQ